MIKIDNVEKVEIDYSAIIKLKCIECGMIQITSAVSTGIIESCPHCHGVDFEIVEE